SRLPRGENRQVPAAYLPRPCRGYRMAVLADGRARADGGTEPSFLPIRAGEDPLRDRSLREGNEPALWRAQQTPVRASVHRRPLFHPRHGGLSVDRSLRTARTKAPGLPPPQALVRSDARAARSATRLCAGQGNQHCADGERRVKGASLRPDGRGGCATSDESPRMYTLQTTA